MSNLILFTILYAMVFILAYFSAIKNPTKPNEIRSGVMHKQYIPYAMGLFAIFVIQLFAAQLIAGYKQDAGLFRAWTWFGNEHKLSEYYTTDLYVDYPPVYLYILFVIGKIAKLMGVSSNQAVFLSFIKFVPILCDSLTSIFIFAIAQEKLGYKKATVLALISAINPTNWLNSTIWGQVDSFTTLITVGLLYALYHKKYIVSCAVFALSFLTKPQMIIFAPLLGFTIFFDLWDCFDDRAKRNKMLGQIGLSILAFAAVLLLVPLPITGGNYNLMIEKYVSAMGMYPYASLNAANFYGAIGANWVKQSERFLLLPYNVWGFVFITAMSLIIGYTTYKIKDRMKIFYLAAFTTSTVFMFAHTMHERYLYSLVLLLMILYIYTKDKRMLWGYFAVSLATFWNCGYVLINNLKDHNHLIDDPLFILLSWAHLLLYGFLVYSGFKMLYRGEFAADNVPLPPVKQKKNTSMQGGKNMAKTNIFTQYTKDLTIQKEAKRVRFNRTDVLLMLGLTLFYSFFAFYQLGSKSVPETGWYPQDAQESIVVDLGEVKPVKDVYAYSGWIDRRRSDSDVKREITMEVSEDGDTWEALEQKMQLHEVFKYKVTTIDKPMRYLRLTVDDGRFYINELAFFGQNEQERYYPTDIKSDSNNQTAHLIIDEQEKIVYEFSWYDGTYFDEIYHPRTAYEHLTHRYPYENTHPPLGKVIISAGIALFGMNPFGWRFFGTLCGVAMVPLAYMLGKKLFKRSTFAFISAFLFTFDFMHLSQTRLATIDSYTTFFVMGMYYFMYKYVKRSFYNEGLPKTLVPLFWSGVFFGLGAATKWQGIYAGVGLACLFALSLGRRYLEYKMAMKAPKKTDKMETIIKVFPRYASQTVIAATCFFVVFPLLIYFISYIPAMNTPATELKFFFTNQSSMYNYHASLKEGHSYGSAWWSWPLDLKPLYAYSPNRSFIPQGTSMGISSFGNPLIWWMTIPVILGLLWRTIRGKGDYESATILLGFAAMYMPWVLVSRVAFIYHFFPCVIFVVLGTVYFIKQSLEEKKLKRSTVVVYMIAVFVLFCMFYPVLTGLQVPTSYVTNYLKWLPSWVLG